jgi:hypothetical protein
MDTTIRFYRKGDISESLMSPLTSYPLVSEKVVRTLLVVWNFVAPNATPALPSPVAVHLHGSRGGVRSPRF